MAIARRILGSLLAASALLGGVCWAQGRSIEIPAEADGNKMLVRVQVEEAAPIWAVLDTGAPAPILLLTQDRLPRQLGWSSPSSIPLGGAGTGNSTSADLYSGIDVEVAGKKFPATRVIVLPQGSDFSANTSAAGWEGVVGGLLFNDYVVEQDYSRGRIVLHDPEGFQPPPQAQEFSLQTGPGGHLFVEAQLRLQGGELRPARLVVDSGAGHALSLQSDPQEKILPPADALEMHLGRGVAGELRGKVGRMPELRLGRFQLRDLVVSFPEPGHMPNVGRRNGNLGMGVLRRFVVYFDIGNRRMYLSPGPDFAEPFRFSATGLQLRPHQQGYTVVGVIDDSPAARAGMRKDDLLLAVDDRPARAIKQDELHRMLREPDVTLRLTYRRGQEENTLELMTRKIL